MKKQELAINSETQRIQIMLQDIKNKIDASTKSRSKEKVKDKIWKLTME